MPSSSLGLSYSTDDATSTSAVDIVSSQHALPLPNPPTLSLFLPFIHISTHMGWFDSVKNAVSSAASSVASSFHRDGATTRFCEKLPIIGYGVAGIQKIAGNDEHAKRAVATATNSTIALGGAAAGFCVAGPVGAVAGAALGSGAGIASEYGISKTIHDEKVKGDVGNVSVGRIVTEVGLSAVGGGFTSGGGAVLASGAREVGKIGLKEAAKQTAQQSLKQVAQVTAKQVIKASVGTLAGSVLAGGKDVIGPKIEKTNPLLQHDDKTGKRSGSDQQLPPLTPVNPDAIPEEGKPGKRVRVCTVAQELQAVQVSASCQAILGANEWHCAALPDLLGNLTQVSGPIGVHHLVPWDPIVVGWRGPAPPANYHQPQGGMAGKYYEDRNSRKHTAINQLLPQPPASNWDREKLEAALEALLCRVDAAVDQLTSLMENDVEYVYV
ncbi:unnamed protein product [Peniophora sp. CBMAI 1063]|nr:unnamed protein product [Peniophora sp. CBMAI 1063]